MLKLLEISLQSFTYFSSDPEILQELQVWKDIVDTQGNVKIGETLVNLQHSECEYNECNIGNFYTDAILDKVSIKI